jgi:gliding motility-associated-like protein
VINSIREVTVQVAPVAGFIYDSVCEGEVNYFENQTVGDYVDSRWIFMNDNDTVYSENTSYTFPTAGDFSVTLIVGGQNGICGDTVTHSVTVIPLPDLSFTADPMFGEPVLDVDFHNDTTGLIDNYWDFGDGNSSSELNTIVSNSYGAVDEYFVTRSGTSVNGCTNSYSLKIIVKYGDVIYEIPNVVTPNSDGINDGFYITYLQSFEIIRDFEIVFLNRWGNVIQTYNKPDFIWDGKTKSGKMVSDGTYFYVMNFKTENGKEYNEHGFVHVVNN